MNYFTVAALALAAIIALGLVLYAVAFRKYRKDPAFRKYVRGPKDRAP
jgi:hypothetical protein